MTASTRFENAVQKLYIAFHNNSLHPECCQQCAVGNILGGSEAWKHLSNEHGSLELNYVGKVNQLLGKKFKGYTPLELLQIEAGFLRGCGYSIPLRHRGKKPANPRDKNILFMGLCAAVTTLCALDGIPNMMDCSQLFAYQPKEKHSILVS